jgi:hypothetical protein
MMAKEEHLSTDCLKRSRDAIRYAELGGVFCFQFDNIRHVCRSSKP